MSVSRTEAAADLSATEVLAAFRLGALDRFPYAQALCDRNRARDPALSVWAWFNEQTFLDAMRLPGSGALAGIPVAVKDILDTFDMPTECGSPFSDPAR